MSYLLSWSIYLWDLLEGVCVEKNALQAEVSTWIWYEQLFTQRRTFKGKMLPLRIKRTRRAKVSAGIYYRKLFAKKENLQYNETIEISRWSLDRNHPNGLWFIYWGPLKIQTSYIKRRGGNTRLSNEVLFLIHGVLKTTLQEDLWKGKEEKTLHTIFHLSFRMIFIVSVSCYSEYSETFSEKKCRSVALVTRYNVISSMKSIYF